MKVTVKFVASLRDVVGKSLVEVDLPSGSTLSDLLSLLLESYPRLSDFSRIIGGLSESIVVLVNGREAGEDYELRDGDVVVLLPPASGGC